jgi:uncharacterized protein (DUF934 family)
VRVGNGALDQAQLDVYGELMGAAERLKDQVDELSNVTREFFVSLVAPGRCQLRRGGEVHRRVRDVVDVVGEDVQHHVRNGFDAFALR